MSEYWAIWDKYRHRWYGICNPTAFISDREAISYLESNGEYDPDRYEPRRVTITVKEK